MLDKSVPYYELWMVRSENEPVPSILLPEGYRFVFYREGDEREWAKIEVSVLEFSNEQEALNYFEQNFTPFTEKLKHRMLFVENEAGEKVATCTAWWREVNGKAIPLLHWLAVKPAFQRKGLAGALVSKVSEYLAELEPSQSIYLHTQTWSHHAIALYKKMGYQLSSENIDGSVNHDYQKAVKILNQLETKD